MNAPHFFAPQRGGRGGWRVHKAMDSQYATCILYVEMWTSPRTESHDNTR